MTKPGTANRPRQVTMAGWLGGAASAGMLISVGQIMARLHTVDLRQSVADFLATQSGTTLGVGLDQALLVARIGLLVTGAASAATLVLAYFATQRDRSARIAMTVLAVPLLVCGVFVDPFLAGFIVAATVLLWTRPAADWFAGRAPQPAAARPGAPIGPTRSDRSGQGPDRPVDQAPPGPPGPAAPPPPTAPSPYRQPYGGASWGDAPAPVPGPYGPVPPEGPGPAAGRRRPRQVTTACLLAASTSALVALSMVATLAALQSHAMVADMRPRIVDNPAFAQAGMSFADVVVMVRVMAVMLLLWAIAGVVVAGFAFRRQAWARIVLTLSASAAGLLALLCSISFPGFLLITAAAASCVILLFKREASAWYDDRG